MHSVAWPLVPSIISESAQREPLVLSMLPWITIAATALAAPLPRETPPGPPMIEGFPPGATFLEATYVCPAGQIEIRIGADADSVHVLSYRGAGHMATDHDLRTWNAFLARRLAAFSHLTVGCSGSGNEIIQIVGRTAEGDPAEAGAYWYEHRLGFYER